MSIQNESQLRNAQRKLKLLEDRIQALCGAPVTNARTRELTFRSLKGLVNQMKEEIAVYSVHQNVSAPSSYAGG